MSTAGAVRALGPAQLSDGRRERNAVADAVFGAGVSPDVTERPKQAGPRPCLISHLASRLWRP